MKRIAAILTAILALFIPSILLRVLIFAIAAALFFASTNKKKRLKRFSNVSKQKYGSGKVDIVAYQQDLETESINNLAETPSNAPLIGQELIDKVLNLGNVETSDLVRACGYVSIKKNGQEHLNINAFYEALLEAKGTPLQSTSNQGKQLDYLVTIESNGSLVIGRKYTALLNLEPGDEFIGIPETSSKSIRLVPKEIAEKEMNYGDEEFKSLVKNKQYNCIVDSNYDITIPSIVTQFIGSVPGEYFKLKLGRAEISLELSNHEQGNKLINANSSHEKEDCTSGRNNYCSTKIRVTVIEAGGEYTVGTLSEPNTKAAVIETINAGRMGSFGTLVNGDDFEATDYDEICHIYGPSIWDEAQIIVEEVSRSGCSENGESTIIYSGRLGDICIGRVNTHIHSAIKSADHDPSNLIICSGKVEKRIHFSVEIELNSDSPFDVTQLWLSCVNTDDPFPNDDYILKEVLYVPKNFVIRVARDFYGVEFEDNWIEDEDFYLNTLEEIFNSENHGAIEITAKIRERYSAEVLHVEGKGEWENDYIKIVRIDGSSEEILFEQEH